MNKKYLLLIVAALIVVAIVLFKYNYNKDYVSTSESPSASPSVSGAAAGGSAGIRAVGTNLTYTQAIEKYEGKRIQFDAYCQGVPKAVVYKNNTTVMFDNRSGDPRVITLDGIKFNLSGHGFKLITLASSKLPHNVNVDCGSAQNVMSILLEK